MGTVYRARKELLEQTVALKVLHPQMTEQEELLSRFLREGRLASRLDHPGIVKVFDVGEDRGRYFIVMEFVDGHDLKSAIAKNGPLGVNDALHVAAQVAAAIGYAHDRGVVHRDIKPANLLWTEEGNVKVADLGLARPIGEDTEVTQTGQVLGTPVFMSPEQCRGESVDARSDLYSLGATLYTLLSGCQPFTGKSVAVLLQQVLHEKPRPLREIRGDLPEPLVAIVQRLMAKHPMTRFQSSDELLEAIREFRVSRIKVAGSGRSSTHAPTSKSASPFPWGSLAGLALLACGLGLYSLQSFDGADTAAAAPKGTIVSPGAPSRPEPPRRQRGPLPVAPPFSWEDDGRPEGEPASFVDGDADAGARGPLGTEIDRRLHGRMELLLEAFVARRRDAVLELLDPGFRENRGSMLALDHLLEKIETHGWRPVSYSIRQRGDRARAMIRMKDGQGFRGVPVDWERRDEEWYAVARKGG